MFPLTEKVPHLRLQVSDLSVTPLFSCLISNGDEYLIRSNRFNFHLINKNISGVRFVKGLEPLM